MVEDIHHEIIQKGRCCSFMFQSAILSGYQNLLRLICQMLTWQHITYVLTNKVDVKSAEMVQCQGMFAFEFSALLLSGSA